MVSRLTLGTAQLGLDYGINNKIGKPQKKKALDILEFAFTNNIRSFDTASVYGDSETILGDFLRNKEHSSRYITSKLGPLAKNEIHHSNLEQEIFQRIQTSLTNLKIECIDNYLIHDFQDIALYDELIPILIKAKSSGLIKSIGVSVYTPQEAEKIIEITEVDTIQIPLSILDQRFLKNSLLKRLKERGFTIFSRSVFLQGLVFMDVNNLPPNLTSANKYLTKLNQLAQENSTNLSKLALGFVNSIEEIDSIIIGVDSVLQLKQNIEDFKSLDIFPFDTSIFANIDENIIDPRKW